MLLRFLLLGLSLTTFTTQAGAVCLETPYDKQTCYTIDNNGEVFDTITGPYSSNTQLSAIIDNIAKETSYQTLQTINPETQSHLSQASLVLTIVGFSIVIISLFRRFCLNKPTNSSNKL